MTRGGRVLGKTGLRLSPLGFGASPLGNVFGDIDASVGERAVHTAIERGIKFFDTSPYYGHTLSEQRLGAALAGRRDSVILSTKLGRYGSADFDFSAARIRTSVDESLRRLRTDHVDLLIAHDIEFVDREQIIEEAVPAMRDLQAAGKTRFVGISGLPLKVLADVAERARVDFVLSYCRYTLLNRDLDRWLTPVLKKHGIGLINAAPVHMGILSTSGPPAFHPAQQEVRSAGAKIVALCKSHGVDPAVVAIYFSLGHPYAASTVVGMISPEQVDHNLTALSYEPDPALMAEIENIAAPVLEQMWLSGRPENND